jgi:tetratricopeptide (TPR) repeat protein
VPVARLVALLLMALLTTPARSAAQPTEGERLGAGILLVSGYQREKAGDLDAALKDFSDAIRAYPQFDRAYLARGGVWLKKGEPDKALADLNTAIDLNPGADLAFTERGKVWAAKKDDARAVADFNEAIRLSPESAFNLMYRAEALTRAGNIERAEADLTPYIALRPKDADGYVHRGFLRMRRGENHRSTFDFDEAVRLKPDHPEAYRGRGAARGRMKEFDKAFADFAEALRLRPKATAVYMDRAAVHLKVPDAPKAIQDYTEVIQLDPDHHPAYHMRAWVRATNPDESARNGVLAVTDARKACDLTNWANPDYIDTLAAAEAECGRFAEAVRYETQALQNDAYAKGKQGDAARWRLKLYEEGKAFREGAPAEVPAAARAPEVPPEKVAAQYVFFGAVGLAVLSMVAFRLRRYGVFPFRRRPVPSNPPTDAPPVTPA